MILSLTVFMGYRHYLRQFRQIIDQQVDNIAIQATARHFSENGNAAKAFWPAAKKIQVGP